jgi:hypothetical protein
MSGDRGSVLHTTNSLITLFLMFSGALPLKTPCVQNAYTLSAPPSNNNFAA